MANFDHSSDTTRKIDTLRRMAIRLKGGQLLKDPGYLLEIADEMERVYRLMIERGTMGAVGTYTGLKDRNGRPIFIGDVVEFDPVEWGGELRFTVGYNKAKGVLDIHGTADDAESWWTVIDDPKKKGS